MQLIRHVVRLSVPRALRNFIRKPQTTGRWLAREITYWFGYKATCNVRDDWDIRCHPNSIPTFQALREVEEFRQELAGFITHLTPGAVLLDIGSHYGAFTLAALHYGGPETRVIAVEPSRESNRILKINLSLAEVGDQVDLIEGAVGAEDGFLMMLTTGPAGEHFMIGADASRTDVIRVTQYTIPTLASHVGCIPTHIKIDVEGYEYEVLLGGQDFLRERKPVIYLELHNQMLIQRALNPERVLNLLAECGYSTLEHQGQLISARKAMGLDVIRLVCLSDANH